MSGFTIVQLDNKTPRVNVSASLATLKSDTYLGTTKGG